MAVPVAVRVGSSVSLACDYDLENEALYSIRWYHADQEFYRFVPKDQPPFKVFALPSFNVDVSHHTPRRSRAFTSSTAVCRCRRLIRGVCVSTTSTRNCPESTSAKCLPTRRFSTRTYAPRTWPSSVTTTSFDHFFIPLTNYLITEVPREGPSLSTDTTKIGVGATLKANCTSPASAHRINLTWYLNGEPLKPPSPMYTAAIINIMSLSNPLYPLETATVTTIAIDVTPLMFKTGKMRVRCLATMFTLYRRTVELELLEDVPHVAMIIKPTPKPPPNYQIYTGESSILSIHSISHSLHSQLLQQVTPTHPQAHNRNYNFYYSSYSSQLYSRNENEATTSDNN